MLALDGAYKSFIYEMPPFERELRWFLLKPNLDLLVL